MDQMIVKRSDQKSQFRSVCLSMFCPEREVDSFRLLFFTKCALFTTAAGSFIQTHSTTGYFTIHATVIIELLFGHSIHTKLT